MSTKSFKSVIAWQHAHKWVLDVYTLTKKFPKDELFGLTSQLRRAAVSVPANIAEGFKRRSLADKTRFYNIAQCSLEECRYYLILTNDLQYGCSKQLLHDVENISKMLEGYCETIKAKSLELEKKK